MSERLVAALDGLQFPWCAGCGDCCHMPWLMDEEAVEGVPLEEEGGARFIASQPGCAACVAKANGLCTVYAQRPLDCRLFPLDIIEEGGVYWWCVYQSCRHPGPLGELLITRIPALEAAMTPAIWAQFVRQIAVTKETYPPYRDGQYRLVREVCLPGIL